MMHRIWTREKKVRKKKQIGVKMKTFIRAGNDYIFHSPPPIAPAHQLSPRGLCYNVIDDELPTCSALLQDGWGEEMTKRCFDASASKPSGCHNLPR